MDERLYLDVISGRRRGFAAGLARGGLSLLAPFYRAAVGARNALYDVGWKRAHRQEIPVVSVGNITTGGTGKTPLVAWLADWFVSHGRPPCVVSRGYRTLKEGGNDELRVLAQLCPDVPHEQDLDRAAAARRAIAAYAPDVLILDDGFQHRRLARDVDIVLVDALNPWGYGRVLPRGLLREPRSSLRRADIVVITRADQVDDSVRSQLRGEVARITPAPLAEVAFRPRRWMSVDGQTAELSAFVGGKLFGFCGIGNPDGFRRTLRGAGYPDVPVEAFPDHHHYTPTELRRLTEEAAACQATALVTTQKDLVKLNLAWLSDLPVWALVIEAEVIVGGANLERLLAGLFRETPPGSTG